MVNTSTGDIRHQGRGRGLETSEASFPSNANVLSNFSPRTKTGTGGACSNLQCVLSQLGPLRIPALPVAAGEGAMGGRGPADLPQLGDCLLKENSTSHIQIVLRFFPSLQ